MKIFKFIICLLIITSIMSSPFLIKDIPKTSATSSFDVTIDFNRSSGLFTVTAKETQDVVVIATTYKNNVKQNMSAFDVKVESSGTKLNLESINLNDADTLKIFVWNTFSDLKPVCNSYTLDLTSLDILNVKNGHLTNKNSEEVVLKGVNFGGWLIQETWMCPILAFDDSVTVKNGTENGWANLDTLNYMEQNYGKEETQSLIRKYQDSYITEWDFENVKNLGFNCIRIPFWYRNFMSDENGTYYTTDDNKNPGFEKLDWAIETAGKYGLKVILDMHGCPGGQSGDHSCGKAGRNYLYKEDKYQQIMEELWVKIANRYRLSEAVASYDIMNEPLNNADANHNVPSKYQANPWVDISSDPRIPVYDRMIKAIRKADQRHNITIEAIWRIDKLPDPETYGWENMMYQMHSYDSDQATTEQQIITPMVNARTKYGVAIYMGEFNPLVYYDGVVELMKSNKINYTVWNYKISGAPSPDSRWALYCKDFTTNILFSGYYDKISSSWNNYFYSLKNLTSSEIKSALTYLWTESRLATKNNNYTFNNDLYNLIK